MATAQTSSPPAPTTTDSRILIPGVTWDEYLKLLDWMGDRHVRVTFDGSTVELMSPSFEHGVGNVLIDRFISLLCLGLGLGIRSARNTTLKLELASKGLEPDECYWIQNEPRVRDNTELDLSVDPPPDLAVEVEVSRSVLNRLGIYADLGVPEIWRYKDGKIHVLLLGDDRQYQPSQSSRCFPMISIEDLEVWLERGRSEGEGDMMREFLAWVQDSILPAWRVANDNAPGA